MTQSTSGFPEITRWLRIYQRVGRAACGWFVTGCPEVGTRGHSVFLTDNFPNSTGSIESCPSGWTTGCACFRRFIAKTIVLLSTGIASYSHSLAIAAASATAQIGIAVKKP